MAYVLMVATVRSLENVPPTHWGRIAEQLAGLGHRLRSVREKRELSQRAVGKLTDGLISTAGVSRIESAQRYPTVESLLVLCLAYDMDVRLTRRGTIEINGTGLQGTGSNPEPTC